MRKTFLATLFLSFMAMTVAAQTEVRVPKPNSQNYEGRAWRVSKTVPKGESFVRDVPFRICGTAETDSPLLVKSVGDGTELRGNLVSANTWTNDDMPYGIYALPAMSGFKVSELQLSSNLKNTSAVYADGKYYSFYVEESWGYVWYITCRVYDAQTWEELNLFEPEPTYANIPYGSALTWDAHDGKIYAVTLGDAGSGYWLSTLNDDASFTRISQLDKAMISLAATDDGTLYGISQDGSLYSISKTTGVETLIGSTGKSPKYAQGMTCDPNTGKLYWAFINDEGSTLYEVNRQNGHVYKIDDMPNFEELVGLYVVSPEKIDDAPMSVTDLAFAPQQDGSLTGTLQCVAPTTNQKGEALDGQLTIAFYCGDETLCEATVEPGATVRKPNVAFEENKLYTIYATAKNTAGTSQKASTTVYVGKDEAGSPTNVQLKITDGTAQLTWQAPTEGAHDGYFDANAVSYKITRFNSSDILGTVVGTTDVGETQFSEKIPTATAYYYYKVTAVSDGKDGGVAQSNKVLSVGAYELPFTDNFDDGDLCKQTYTFVDVNGDREDSGDIYVFNAWYWKSDEKLMQIFVNQNNPKAQDDWLITPAIHFDGKHIYNLSYSINMGATSNLRVTLGKSTDPASHTTVIDNLEGICENWQTYHNVTFTVPEDDNYYLGFYSDTGTDGYYFNLFDINIEEGMSTEIPDSVTNLKVTAADRGEEKVNISYNAPATLVNEKAIVGTFKVNTYRGDELIHTDDVTAGQAVSFTDEMPKSGSNTYKVMATSNGKDGVEATQTVWVGFDVPEAVSNMKAVAVDGNMHILLTWDAPQKGTHGGFFDPDLLTYSVWRSNDGNNYEKIATEITKLTYTDVQIEEVLAGKQSAYYYAVTADMKGQQSEAAAKYVVVGTPYTVPQKESFPNGQFDIQPWSTESIEGYYGFECMKSDASGGGYPQDADKGFTKFYNPWWSDRVDSRLKTPVFSLRGSTNPAFSFFMFHWLESTVASDNKTTTCQVEISVDGGEFQPISDEIPAASERYGWEEHRFSLADYKDAETVQLSFRGRISNTWMYYYIDNIRLEEQKDYDLSISAFSGNSSAAVGDSVSYRISYFNRGLKDSGEFTVRLYFDDNEVANQKVESLSQGEINDMELKVPVSAVYADKTVQVKAVIDYAEDEMTDNNTSPIKQLAVEGAWYPTPEGLQGELTDNGISLTWNDYEAPTNVEATEDGFEDYEPFAISGFGEWKTYDGDKHGCGSYNDLPSYPNKGVNQAWQVWAPAYLDGVTADVWPGLQPHTGNQSLISWYANTSIDFDSPYNKDYLISQQVSAGSVVSFWIRRVSADDNEKYQIMYSTTSQDPDAFVVLREGLANEEWTREEFTLPADARYFAICYVGELQRGIMIDDVTYTSAIADLKILGYNVFRDKVKLNTELIEKPSYIDTDNDGASHSYQVSAIYNFGESDACKPINVTFNGINATHSLANISTKNCAICVATDRNLPVNIFTVDGRSVASSLVDGQHTFKVTHGVYLVDVAGHITKVTVRP